MDFALNQMTVPRLGYEAFLDLAAGMGCVGVEVRNDLGRPLFDGLAAAEAGRLAAAKGLRLVGMSQVYPFNRWSDAVRDEVLALVAAAKASGAETISLIPCNDGTGTGNGERQANLRIALKEVLPILREQEMVALVEPLGFLTSSLRDKAEAVEVIEALGGAAHLKLVHDTFHHHLAGGGPLFPDHTGIVHVSGVTDPGLGVADMRDAHRVLVDAGDRLGNTGQIAALFEAGYRGVVSYECFAPEVHAIDAPGRAIAESLAFIEKQVTAKAA